MAIYTHTNRIPDLRRRYKEIREDVQAARSDKDLDELYKRTVYVIMLTHVTPGNEKLDRSLKTERIIAESEFARTIRQINSQAKKLGTETHYDKTWKGLSTNGYKVEGENLFEPAKETIGK